MKTEWSAVHNRHHHESWRCLTSSQFRAGNIPVSPVSPVSLLTCFCIHSQCLSPTRSVCTFFTTFGFLPSVTSAVAHYNLEMDFKKARMGKTGAAQCFQETTRSSQKQERDINAKRTNHIQGKNPSVLKERMTIPDMELSPLATVTALCPPAGEQWYCRSLCAGLQTSCYCSINPLIQAFVLVMAVVLFYVHVHDGIDCSKEPGLLSSTALPPKLPSDEPLGASVGGLWCKLYFPLTSLPLSLALFFIANTKLFLIRCC